MSKTYQQGGSHAGRRVDQSVGFANCYIAPLGTAAGAPSVSHFERAVPVETSEDLVKMPETYKRVDITSDIYISGTLRAPSDVLHPPPYHGDIVTIGYNETIR